MHYDINLLYLHVTLPWFPLEKKGLRDQAVPPLVPSTPIALQQLKQGGSGLDVKFFFNKSAQYMAQALHVFLTVNVHCLPGTKT